MIRVYVKGAPEYIVTKCSRTFGVSGDKIPMTDEELNYILSDIISKEFTTKGLRVLACAYKDMTLDEYEQLK